MVSVTGGEVDARLGQEDPALLRAVMIAETECFTRMLDLTLDSLLVIYALHTLQMLISHDLPRMHHPALSPYCTVPLIGPKL